MNSKKTFFQSIFTSREIISSVNADEKIDENIEKKMLELLREQNGENSQDEDEYSDILQLLNQSAQKDIQPMVEKFDENKNSSIIEKLNEESGLISLGIDILDEEEGGFDSVRESKVTKNDNKEIEAEYLVKTGTNNKEDINNMEDTVVFNSKKFKEKVDNFEKKSTQIDVEEESNVDIPLM